MAGLKAKWAEYRQSMQADAAQAESRRLAYVAKLEVEHQKRKEAHETFVQSMQVATPALAPVQATGPTPIAVPVITQQVQPVAIQVLPVATMPAQLIKIYKGKHMDHDFQREAAHLAKQGWQVDSVNYGGMGRITAGQFLLRGFRAPRGASEMTVIYKR